MAPRFRLFRAFGDDFGLACACERLVLGVDALGPFTRPVRLGGGNRDLFRLLRDRHKSAISGYAL